MSTIAYKRILLKLSGEALMGEDKYGINSAVMGKIVSEIEEISKLGVEIAIVVGGGNIFRGMKSTNDALERVTADYMGMLATVMNALALQDAMKLAGLVPRIQSALRIDQVVEPYIRGRAMRYLKDGKIVIFAAGTGNPFFTTDTAAALRGMEMNVDIMLKATKVDGIYTSDPKINPDATQAGKSLEPLFDPTSAEYLGQYVPQYQRSAQEILRDMGSNMQMRPAGSGLAINPETSGTPPPRGTPPPKATRLPNESAADFLKRTKGQ